MSYTHFGGDSFNAGRMHVEQSGVSSTAGGLGLEIGKNFGAGNIYTRVGVNHAFSGIVKLRTQVVLLLNTHPKT